MGLFSSKRRTIVPSPTAYTEAWFDDLVAKTPADAGLEPSDANLAYVRDFLTVMVLDDAIINAMVIDGDGDARAQYEELIASTDSLEQRVAFLNGWNAMYVPMMHDRVLRQRQKFLVDEAREDGGYPVQSRAQIRLELAEYRRAKPYG